MSAPPSSSDPDANPSSEPSNPDTSRTPFVEPELRRETDLIRGTGDRHHFESTAS
ncbi:hypothetical protein [Salinibacter altiplanensis]|uniref:hypothetical protein n=1 Tax=Salinibacter altiplanensis TaxID=1803181 RepID=UPI00131A6078|nr:hypothetical protein [Salinibacter altiplanensis]